MRGFMRVHLVDGGTVDSNTDEAADDDLTKIKDFMGDLMKSSDGWQVSLDLPSGGWAMFPKDSVRYIEWVPEPVSGSQP